MSDWFLAIGNIYIPLAFVFMILAVNNDGWFSLGLLICGVAFLVAGIIAMRESWKIFKTRDNEEKELREKLMNTMEKLNDNLNKSS